MRHRLLFLTTIVCSLSVAAAAEQQVYPRADLLVEPEVLADPAASARYVILDVRSRSQYEHGHVPGARWVDAGQWQTAFSNQDAEAWSHRIRELGIDADSAVVVYDDQLQKDAARVWWILRYWGVSNARLLNGDWKTWTSRGLPTTDKAPQAAVATSFQAQAQPKRLATKDQLLESLESVQIVDARSQDEFCGVSKLAQRAGAIPGAKHLEWSDVIDPQSRQFKGPLQLQELFRQSGIDLQQPTATHCQSGGRSSVMAFALELMGGQDVRNYYRGWSEWGNDSQTPVEPGKLE